MILYVMRHGLPDYSADILTEEGRREANAVAQRLSTCGITSIFSSPMGRAVETAQPLSKMLGIPIFTEEWASELGAESRTDFPDGKRKPLLLVPSEYYNGNDNARLTTEDVFRDKEPFKSCDIAEKYRSVADGLDGFLCRLGYRRTDKDLYHSEKPNDQRVALYCHRGITGIIVSHLLNIPYQFVAGAIYNTYGSITVFRFPSELCGDFAPTMLSFGDAGHLGAPDIPRRFPLSGELF